MVMAPTNMAVDPFRGARQMRAPETQADVPLPEIDEIVEKTFNEYIQARRIDPSTGQHFNLRRNTEAMKGKIILTPLQIETLFTRLSDYQAIAADRYDLIGLYISSIIQYSYNAGYNNFSLHTGDVPLKNILEYLDGKESDPIVVGIVGNVAGWSGSSSKNLSLTLFGSSQECFAMWSSSCEYHVEDQIFPAWSTENCTFKTHNPEIYRWLADTDNWQPLRFWHMGPSYKDCKNNTVILLGENDKMIEQKVMP
jgi:hypothetical protein